MTSELLERAAQALVDGKVVEPPITRISLDEAPAGQPDKSRLRRLYR